MGEERLGRAIGACTRLKHELSATRATAGYCHVVLASAGGQRLASGVSCVEPVGEQAPPPVEMHALRAAKLAKRHRSQRKYGLDLAPTKNSNQGERELGGYNI